MESVIIITKTCKSCKGELSLEKFSKKRAICKSCVNDSLKLIRKKKITKNLKPDIIYNTNKIPEELENFIQTRLPPKTKFDLFSDDIRESTKEDGISQICEDSSLNRKQAEELLNLKNLVLSLKEEVKEVSNQEKENKISIQNYFNPIYTKEDEKRAKGSFSRKDEKEQCSSKDCKIFKHSMESHFNRMQNSYQRMDETVERKLEELKIPLETINFLIEKNQEQEGKIEKLEKLVLSLI